MLVVCYLVISLLLIEMFLLYVRYKFFGLTLTKFLFSLYKLNCILINVFQLIMIFLD